MGSKKAEVFFIKDQYLKKLKKLLLNSFRGFNSLRVSIKVHMGEFGNLNYVRPPIVRTVVDAIKEKGGKPFVIDSPAAYLGSRHTVKDYLETAKKNGFTKETIGCPIEVSNKGIKISTKGHIKEIEAIKEVVDSQYLVVLSHFKGHEASGFGGAIKNIGMGCFTKNSKSKLHQLAQPKIDINKCQGCGRCIEVCPKKANYIKNGKAKINYDKCFGCCICVENCPQKAIKIKTGGSLKELLVEATKALISNFSSQKLFFINVLMDIYSKCDCDADFGEMIVPDIGFLISQDMVAIDKASYDLICKTIGFDFCDKYYHLDIGNFFAATKEYKLGNQNYKLKKI